MSWCSTAEGEYSTVEVVCSTERVEGHPSTHLKQVLAPGADEPCHLNEGQPNVHLSNIILLPPDPHHAINSLLPLRPTRCRCWLPPPTLEGGVLVGKILEESGPVGGHEEPEFQDPDPPFCAQSSHQGCPQRLLHLHS